MKTPKIDYNAMTADDLVARDKSIMEALADDSITPHDLGLHLGRLSERAFKTGERKCIEIISSWLSPNHSNMHRAWALWSILRAGFLGSFEKTIFTMLEGVDGRQIIKMLVNGTILTPESAGHYMALAMSASDTEELLSFLDKRRPWISEGAQIESSKQIVASAVRSWREKNKGSWD